MNIESLWQLPEYIQIVLVTGYIGHSVAKAGYRSGERKDELFYGVMVFGLIGYVFFMLSQSAYDVFVISVIISVSVTMMSAMIWRKSLKRQVDRFFNWAGVSNEDGIPTVLSRLTQDTGIAMTQISVHLKNGSCLECDDVQAFRGMAVPLCYTDDNGNIALYVTGKKDSEGVYTCMDEISDASMGDRITYIPKEEVSRVAFRFLRK